MDKIRIGIAGFGNVGRSFANYVRNIPAIEIISVANSTGTIVLRSRAELDDILHSTANGNRLEQTTEPDAPRLESAADYAAFLRELRVTTFVEALPTNIESGSPALELIRETLSAGIDVVTVDKGPMVRGFDVLRKAAADSGTKIGYTGTIGVAIPDSLTGCTVKEIRGVLNGTTNYILSEMLTGASFNDALAQAQSDGIAEPDPSLDVQGWDTACKILILANTLMNARASLEEVTRIVIGQETEDLFRVARETGRRVRLVGRARIWQGRVRLSVAPKLVGPDSPFYDVDGTSKLAVFNTAEQGEIVSRSRSGRNAIAEVILQDLRSIYSDLKLESPGE